MGKCAFDLDKKCAALTKKDCKGCRFRKTKEELEEGRSKARERIIGMAPHVKNCLVNKYHARDKEFKPL
jgi:uncharacterized protein (UPF0179 family)